MHKFRFSCAAALSLALAACNSGTEPAAPASEEQSAAPVATTGSADPVDADGIPAVLQGRWGLVAADCTSTAGDAKGLLTIEPGKLTFYESVAELGSVEERGPDNVTGSFQFSGEGQTWLLDVTLSTPDGGQTLVRKDTGPDAAPEPLTYTKCP